MWILKRLSFLQAVGLAISAGLIGMVVMFLTGNEDPVSWLFLILSVVGFLSFHAISTFANKDVEGDKQQPLVEWALLKRLSFLAAGLSILAILIGIFVQYLHGEFEPVSLLFPLMLLVGFLILFFTFSFFRKRELEGNRPNFAVEWITDDNTSDERKKHLIKFIYMITLALFSIVFLCFGISVLIILVSTTPA